jgi:hypothetical protein
MVKKMNKSAFIKELAKATGISEENSMIVNQILEDNFFISKKSKDKIISEIVLHLDVNLDTATNIYNTATKIAKDSIKFKLKHPFKEYKAE